MQYSTYELSPQYDSRKSFYGKALVEVSGKNKVLYSYGTRVVTISEQGAEFTRSAWYSLTTRRHVREFCRQENIPNPYDKR